MLFESALILIFTWQIVPAASQCCQQLDKNECLKCPQGMHLYRNNCIYDIPHCIRYEAGFDCLQCEVNYQLIDSTCQHLRLHIDIEKITNFMPYMQSAIKPNPFFNYALDVISKNADVWCDWVEERQRGNLITSAKRKAKASILQNRILVNTSLLYIYTANDNFNNQNLVIFRLTYELANPYGFADILVAVDTKDSQVNFLQIVEVRVAELEAKGWELLAQNNTIKIQIMLTDLIGSIAQQQLLKSWWKSTSRGYNFTLFYMDGRYGVITYTYIAAQDRLSRLGIQISSKIKDQDSAKDSFAYTNNTYKDDNRGTNENNFSSNNQNSSSKNKQLTTNQQLFMDVKQVLQDEKILAGYAVAFKLPYVPHHSVLEAASTFKANSTFCLYFMCNGTHYEFMFHINKAKANLQVLYFAASNFSIIANKQNDLKNQNHPTNDTASNKAANESRNKAQQVIAYNKGNKNSIEFLQKQQNATKANQTKKTQVIQNAQSNLTTLPSKSNTNFSLDCLQPLSTSIDITNRTSEDVYMPNINLLLMTMYSEVLKDSRIGQASYSWAIDSKTSLSTITYNVTYLTSFNQQYEFQIKIINNQLTFTKVPPNIKQSGILPANTSQIKSSNSNSLKSDNGVNFTTNQDQTQASMNKSVDNSSNLAKKTENSSHLQDSFNKDDPIVRTQTLANVIKGTGQIKQKSQQSFKQTTNVDNIQTSDNHTIENQTSKSVISMEEFQSNPKYKPIVDIARLIKRVPYNASMQKMEQWSENNQSFYSVVFVMKFTTPLSDSSSRKTFSLNVRVNQSNYITIYSFNTTYCCVQADQHAIQPRAATMPVVLKSTGAIKESPYTIQLIPILQGHSPGLKKMNAKMMDFRTVQDKCSISDCFVQKLRFKGEMNVLCYDIRYCVVNLLNPSETKVVIRKYHVTYCNEELQNKFLYNLTAAKFVDSQRQNQALNELIAKIRSRKQTNFKQYLQYSNFYFVDYNDPAIGDIQVLYDSTNSIVLSYCEKPALLYTPLAQNINLTVAEKVLRQIQQEFFMKGHQLQTIYIQELKFNGHICMRIFVVDKSAFWGLQLQRLYQFNTKFNQSNSSLFIINTTFIQSNRQEYIEINSPVLSGFYHIPFKTVVQSSQFSSLMKSISVKHSTFLESSNVDAIFVQSYQKLQHLLNNSWSQQVLVKVLITKKYTDSYYSNYVISANFVPDNGSTQIKSIEIVDSEAVKTKNCKENINVQGSSLCGKCQTGYNLINQKCIKQIENCLQYYDSWCVRCGEGHVVNHLSKCNQANSAGQLIAYINDYLIAMSQD